ncbi:Multicopper oxidase [Ceratobasidium sp. AG-Ba]|nr:Multicopper oxidase [Ceratobasidium sp. AG-Ba]
MSQPQTKTIKTIRYNEFRHRICDIQSPIFPSVHRSQLSLSLLAISTRLTTAAFVDYTLNIVNTQISPDGFTRSASLVNGVFPGTVLFANKGDVLRNTVVNQLTDPSMRRSTTIHWHGLYQRTTAYEDGPAFVTQCPIAPASSYQYVIPTLDQAGTHWYHSHLGSQYVDGVRSAIVIYDPDDPHKSLYDVDDASTYHTPAPALADEYFESGNEPVPDTGLINGRGRYKGGPAAPGRLSTSSKANDGHPLKIVEADGLAHEPLIVNSLDIHPGERYSIVVEANQTVGNYWIRAPITARRSSSTLDPSLVRAVLRYKGAPANDPTTSQTSGTTLDISNLRPVENPGAPGGSAPADVVIDLNYGGISGGKTGWQVNGSQYQSPSLPTLLKILSNNATTNNDFATSENTIVLPYDKVIELQIHRSSNGFFHPWHLHGHSFDIIQNGGAINYVNPPRKDVIPVGGGTAIIRFKTSNPGPWFLHCAWRSAAILIGIWRPVSPLIYSISYSAANAFLGLAVVFAEAPNEQRAGPKAIQPSSGWNQLCSAYQALPADQQ